MNLSVLSPVKMTSMGNEESKYTSTVFIVGTPFPTSTYLLTV